MRLQVLELDHVSEINQEVAAEVCREGLKGLEMLVLTSTPVTPKALLHFNSKFENDCIQDSRPCVSGLYSFCHTLNVLYRSTDKYL